MISTQALTLDQIRQTGLEALARALGPVGLIRFLQQFEMGAGDYSRERHNWLPQGDVQALAAEIQQRRTSAP
ncbi:MAG TPA: hypothetical protein VFB38_13810 [Chthonomonadaceae bacterium]|nr:hypothetical protein [Chthonomonadaceae bacterium]